MKRIILVENYQLGIKKAFSTLKKAVEFTGVTYWKAYKPITNKGIYRADNDYILTRLKVE